MPVNLSRNKTLQRNKINCNMRNYNPLSFPIGIVEVMVITSLNEGKFASGENFIARQSHKSCQKNNNF